MIQVCHFTNGHDSFDARVFHKQCRSLAEAGYEVYLVGPDGVNQDRDGVHIRSVAITYSSRWKRMLLVGRKVFEAAVALDAEIYHFHDPELIPFGLKLKRLGKKVIFDSHEDSPADISAKSWIPGFLRPVVARIYAAYERRAIRIFDAVISVTPHVVNRFLRTNAKSYLVTNYPIIDPSEVVISAGRARKICYVGRIGDENLQRTVVRALEQVKDARYVLAGPSSPAYIEELKALPGWEKVDFLGTITHLESRSLYRTCYAGVQLMDYIPNVGYKIGTLGNTKFFAYLEAGIPIICTDFILWKEIIDKYECGICVEPNDVDAIAAAMNYLLEDAGRAARMGENGRRAILEHYNWDTQRDTLLRCYSGLGL